MASFYRGTLQRNLSRDAEAGCDYDDVVLIYQKTSKF